MSETPIINLTEVSFQWPGATGFTLSVPSFSVAQGDSVLLLGESGSGKSTLLSLICGTALPQSGTVEVAGQNLEHLSGGARDRFRADHIGVVFQQFNLLPFGSVEDNILLPLRFAPERQKRCQNPRDEAAKLCDALGLSRGLLPQKAAKLSVGQQQRVAVARALIGAPPLLIADEPTSALDETRQAQFLDLLFAQVRAVGGTLLMVSHDPRIASRFDRTVSMSDLLQKQEIPS